MKISVFLTSDHANSPVLFLAVERPRGGDEAGSRIDSEQIGSSVFERISDEAVVALILVGSQNRDDGGAETSVLRDGSGVTNLI